MDLCEWASVYAEVSPQRGNKISELDLKAFLFHIANSHVLSATEIADAG